MAKFTYTAKSGLSIEDNKTAKGTIDIYGLAGNVQSTTVNLKGLSHTYASDLDMLLVSPNKSNLAFLTDAGGPSDFSYYDLQFADAGAPLILDFLNGSTYKPIDLGDDEAAANWGLNNLTIHHASNGATFANQFGGENGNGIWSLYIRDDAPGIHGSLNGWGLTLTTNEGSASLNGGGGSDTIQVLTTDAGAGKGSFQINERGSVQFEQASFFYINGNGGDDKIFGDQESDSVRGGAGKDYVSTGGGTDYIRVGATDDVAGETYDGGSAFDYLYKESYQTLDLRDDTFKNIESVSFVTGGMMQITASQMGGVTTLYGAFDITHPDVVEVTMGASGYVNLSSKNFFSFDQAGDKVFIIGDGDAETILASNMNDVIKSGGGADLIVTYQGIDKVDGGKGRDTVSYLTRDKSINVTLDGKQQVGVKVDGLVEDKIKNVENIVGGSAADVLKGDELANVFKGSEGNDKLKGYAGNDKLEGGTGLDTLVGGSGKDKFVFATGLDAADHIKDFSHADDTIVLDNSVFAAFVSTGDITSKMFHANASGHDAHTAKQFLIYDKADHSLWYDADGNGAGAAVEVAIFDNGIKNLDYHDFRIV